MRETDTIESNWINVWRNKEAYDVSEPMVVTQDRPVLKTLKGQWCLVAAVWLLIWLLGYWLLRPIWPGHNRWLLLSGLTLAYGLWVLWRGLLDNRHTETGKLLRSFGPGNHLSLVRGLCIGLLAGFLFGPWPMGALAWWIVLLYTIADVSDYLDGYVARRANHTTTLGGILDMEFDSVGTLVVILLAVSFGQLPWWYLGLGLARYFFIFGLWLRQRLNLPVYEMTPSVHRRISAGFQMGFLSAVLWPILPRPMALIAGLLFGLATAASFLRDWLVVSGVVKPQSMSYQRVQAQLYQLFVRRLPLLWRAGLVVTMLSIFIAADPGWRPSAWEALLRAWNVPLAGTLTILLAIGGIVGTWLAALGIVGRLATMGVIFPIGFDIASRGLQWDNGLALVCAVCLMVLGTGIASLWPAEERFFQQRLGSRDGAETTIK
jgi:CDP-diacylglycerol--glycerol-3-phosphate 3-phosphatidyltransferase